MPDGVYEAEVGWLDDDGQQPRQPLPVKVKVIIEGDELTIDVTGSSDEVADRLQLPVRGHDRLGGDLHRAHDLPRRGDLSRVRAAERGHAAAGPA